ncbi:MAG: hypothetical protein IJ196_00030 [Prevotella sp.]|nr:hypothetical protein [Prevotella sp.]
MMEKKKYMEPCVEAVGILEPLLVVESQNIDGKVDGEEDTNWGFGGDGDPNDDPQAKGGSWESFDMWN